MADPKAGTAGSDREEEAGPIYHLALPAELEAGCRAGFLAPPRLAEDGFVHCAPRDLVLAVADDYLAGAVGPVWLLEIDPARLSAPVVWEAPAPIAGGGGAHRLPGRRFPHVYGPLELDAIVRAGALGRQAPRSAGQAGRYAWPARMQPFEPPAGAAHVGSASEAALARTRASYDRVAGRFLQKTHDRSGVLPWMDRLAARLPAAARVLDAGGGPGLDSAALGARGLRPVCVDLSLGMLREGLRHAPKAGPRVQGDLRGLPFAAGSFDAVWANASLLHLRPAGLDRALAELRRVQRPGGLTHVSVKAGDGGAWDLARYGEPRWFQYWRAGPLDVRLRAAGFEVLLAEQAEGRHEDWLVRLLRAV